MANIANTLTPDNTLLPQDMLPNVGMQPQPAPIAKTLNPLQQNIANDQQQLQKVQWHQQNPWGTANNHPGTFGKIAHVLSVAGNIAGDIVAPNIMERLPGTQYGMQEQANGLTHRLNAEQQEESQNEGRDATTQATQLANAAEPEKAKLGNELTQSTIARNAAETGAIENPKNPLEHFASDDGFYSFNPKTGEVKPLTMNGQPIQPKSKLSYETVTGPDGKPHTYGMDERGNKKVDEGVHYEKPTQGPSITMVVPDGNGGGKVERLTPGQSVAPGAMSATQFGSQNTQTTQQRNVGAQAQLVHEQTPQLLSQIDQLHGKIGPMAGRWNEFMQGKVGANDPEMADLRANLLMYSSAVALMHARGRLPENLREEFDHAINAPNQTPENLKAVIHRIDSWTAANMNAMHTGGGNHNSSGSDSGAPPPGAKVRDYTSFGGGK